MHRAVKRCAAVALMLSGPGFVLLGAGPGYAGDGSRAASTVWSTPHLKTHPDWPSVKLYSQNHRSAGFAVVSQQFKGAQDAYDSVAADSFVIPAPQMWTIKGVEVTGSYANGGGPASSETVTFYADAGGKPGKVLKVIEAHGLDNDGSFRIPGIRGLKLRSGQYWLSVQADMQSAVGEWGWMSRHGQKGDPAVWENPSDGFGTGCTEWQVIATCLGDSGQGPDLMFALRGTAIHEGLGQ
jgi:hypothetical protein